jgi:hypothetical protein
VLGILKILPVYYFDGGRHPVFIQHKIYTDWQVLIYHGRIHGHIRRLVLISFGSTFCFPEDLRIPFICEATRKNLTAIFEKI